MKVRTGPALAVLSSVALAGLGAAYLSTVASAAGSTPPYEPDPNQGGTITFYDAAGAVKTSGNIDDAVFATYAVGSAPGASGDKKASLYGYVPKSGQATGQFSGEQLAGPTSYPNTTFPGPAGTTANPVVKNTGDVTLRTLTQDFPNTATSSDPYYGLYQLRIKTAPVGTDPKYQVADLFIDTTKGTWTQVYPAPATQPTTAPPTTAPPTTAPPTTAPPTTAPPTTAPPTTAPPTTAPPTTAPPTTRPPTTAPPTTAPPTTAPPTGAPSTAPPTAGPTADCYVPGIDVEPTPIVAGQTRDVRTIGQPGHVLQLWAYTRPSTTYRVVRSVTLDDSGVATFAVQPASDTRLFAKMTNCDGTSDTAVIPVRSRVSESITRTGTRTYRFSGRVFPAASGSVVDVYRVAGGRRVLTTQASVGSDGTWAASRAFTGTGTFSFTATVGATGNNQPGTSPAVRATID